MTNTKIIAQTNFDHDVKLIQTEHVTFGHSPAWDVKTYTYIVTYGAHTRDCGSDFESAWREFGECSVHAAQCASLLPDFVEQEDEE